MDMPVEIVDKKQHLSGEDKVIVYCVALLTILTIVALCALVLQPSQTNTIIPVMAGTVIAISSLAARHPPSTPQAGPVVPIATPVDETKSAQVESTT